MKSKQTKTVRNGFVIIVVLCMVILMTALLLGFNRKARANLLIAESFRKSGQALNCARAGLNIAITAVRDADNVDTDKAPPSLLSEKNSFALDNGKCFVTITDESSKLNVNLLKDKNGKLNRAGTDQLLRLIDLLNRDNSGHPDIDYSLVPSIIDWTDSDNQVTELSFVKYDNSGAESGYYNQLSSPYKCKNRPFETTEELALVKTMTPEILARIYDYVTVYGDGKVNINSAAKRVIESLSEKMDPALAQIIIDRRKVRPFDSITELRDVPGMTDGIYQSIRKTVAVSPTSQYYYVTSQGSVDQLECAIAAMLRKNTNTKNIEVVLYKEL